MCVRACVRASYYSIDCIVSVLFFSVRFVLVCAGAIIIINPSGLLSNFFLFIEDVTNSLSRNNSRHLDLTTNYNLHKLPIKHKISFLETASRFVIDYIGSCIHQLTPGDNNPGYSKFPRFWKQVKEPDNLYQRLPGKWKIWKNSVSFQDTHKNQDRPNTTE